MSCSLQVILSKVCSLVESYSLPIYVQSKNSKLILVGTGFLAKRSERTVLVTAAHCIEYVYDLQRRESYMGALAIAFEDKIYPIVGREQFLLPKKGGAWSSLDIATLDVTSKHEILYDANDLIISLDEACTTSLDESISVAGYSLKNNKNPVPYNASNKDKVISVLSFFGGTPTRPDYDLVPFGLSNDFHCAAHWNRTNQHSQTIPSPRGLSGAPVWTHSQSRSKPQPSLAGVFIEYRENENIAVFTRICKLSQFIDLAYS